MVTTRLARFTVGEFDPLLMARNEIDPYYSALEKARNVVILTQGGFKRRPGSQKIDRLHRKVDRYLAPTITAPNGGTIANVNDDNTATELTTTTNVSNTNPYVVVHYDLGVARDIAFVDVVGARLALGDSDQFFVQVSNDNATWTYVGNGISLSTTNTTERRRVRGSYRYVRFARASETVLSNLGADTVSLGEFHVWIESADLSASRLVDFKFNINQSYMLVFTDKNMAVYKNRVYQADVRTVTSDTINYDSSKMETLNWTTAEDTLILFHEDVPMHSIMRQGSDSKWALKQIEFDYIPKYDFNKITVRPVATLTPSAISGKITLAASAASFTAADVDQIVEGNGGRARISSFTSATSVEAIAEIPFYNTNAIPSQRWDLQRGWENAWSATRGYPRSGTFYQDRLWIGGTKSKPSTIFGSVIGDYFNFDPGSVRDTDAYDRNLDNNDLIVNMLSHQTLQVFALESEAAAIQTRGTALTPNTPGLMPQTDYGSRYGLRPVVSNGVILFVQNSGKSIARILFSEEQQSFTAANISLYSSHLINNPVDFNIRKSTDTETGNYLLIVNSDGTMATSSLLQEENVRGFSLWSTNGLYKNVNVDYDDIYSVVERTTDGTQERYLEVFDFSHLLDASIKYTTGFPTNILTGLDHLEGQEVRIRVDGNVLDNQIVINGQITLPYNAEESAEVGLGFKPLVKTMPYENPQVIGETIGQPKRINEVYVWIYNTGEVLVNDYLISLKDFGGADVSPLDAPNPLRNGIYKVSGLEGWDDLGQVTITQENPLPMTVLAIGLKVTV